MDTLDSARRILEEAEAKLRGLVSEAARDGRYEDVLTVTEWAKRVGNLAGRESGVAGPSRAAGNDRDSESHGVENGNPAGYPRFHRDRDFVIKVSRSKRNGTEYEHRAPKEVLASLLAGLSRGGARKRPIAIESLIPMHSRQNAPIPNYQVYVALAFLRERGVVEQHGRQGYRLTSSSTDTLELAEKLWRQLPDEGAA